MLLARLNIAIQVQVEIDQAKSSSMYELRDLVKSRSIAVLILSVTFITWGIFPCISLVLIGLTAKPLGLAFQAISEMTAETSKLTVELDE